MRRVAWFQLHLGVVAIVLALSKAHARYIGHYDFTESPRVLWAAVFVVLTSATAYGLGLPDGPRTRRDRLVTAVATAAVAALGMSAVQLVAGSALLPRFVVFGTAMALVPWTVVSVRLATVGRNRQADRDRVVVVSDLPVAVELRSELDGRAERPASVVASIFLDEVVGAKAEPGALAALVGEYRGTVVVLGPDAQADERVIEQAAALHVTGLRVRTLSLFYEEWLGKIPVGDLARVSLFFDIGEVHRARYGRFKRMLDVVFGLVGLGVCAVAIPVVAVGNLLANRGPLFYSQERIGRGGAPFRILKFRTMSPEGAASNWTSDGDPRVTRFGRVLRRTHLDELPQALNILRGDLSIVGPRPEQPVYVDELTTKLPFYSLRHCVRPGLTGWAQVKYGYAGDEADAREKLQYDFHYLRRQSIGFDLRIVARTVRSVMAGDGR